VLHVILAEDAELLLLLLLPGLLFFFPARLPCWPRHPAASPPAVHPLLRRLQRASRPDRRPGPASRSWRSPTSGWGRLPRPRSRPRTASPLPGSPTNWSGAGRPPPLATHASASRPRSRRVCAPPARLLTKCRHPPPL